MKRILLMVLLGVFIAAAVSISCGNNNIQHTDERLQVVATTTMLSDIARELGGDKVVVTGLMGAGIDPHTYRASAGDVTRLFEADIVICNGLGLEGKMADMLLKLLDMGRVVLSVQEAIDTDKLIMNDAIGTSYDPHVWFDVRLWIDVADYIAKGFIMNDPDNADYYANRAEVYIAELYELDDYVRQCSQSLPEEKRVLVTAHDAFGYFGRAYGFEVYGIQGISTNTEAGTLDMSRLAELMVQREIHALFAETSVSPKTIEALESAVIARGGRVSIGDKLYSDSLGDADSQASTYISAIRSNINTIVCALSEEG